jgi:predicted nucleotide-binding protein
MNKAKTVFLVHGRDDLAAHWMRNFLRALGLSPLEWSQAVALTGSGAPYILDVIRAGMEAAQATVVLFTPDEEVRLRASLASTVDVEAGLQSRPNVWFEAGIAIGLYPRNTTLVTIGPNRPASDLSGIHFIHLTDAPGSLLALSQRLSTTGCDVVTTGTDFVKTPALYTKV